MDGVFVADWINASPTIGYAATVSEALAVHQQSLTQDTSQRLIIEETHQITTTTHLGDSVEDKNLEKDSFLRDKPSPDSSTKN